MSDADSESELDTTRPLVSKPRSHNPTAAVRRPNKFRRKRRLLLCFGAVAMVAAIVLLCVIIFSDNEVDYDWDVSSAPTRRMNASAPNRWVNASAPTRRMYAPRTRITILLWQWDETERLRPSDCQILKVSAIQLEELANRSDAIIFNATATDYTAAPLALRHQPLPYYIYALERPLNATARQRADVGDLATFFDLTLSYKLDSDIPWLTHEWYDVNQGRIQAPRLQPHWVDPGTSTYFDFEYNATQPLLALTIMESPCNRTRNRLLLEIQKSIDVDVYGDCGAPTCPLDCKALPRSRNGTTYKFYFAFEDEFCTDYVSRYLYLALQEGIVPVVLGGANYTRFAPPHSYIEAEAFQSAHQLVTYLQYLHAHKDEYRKYLAWRQHYFIQPAEAPYQAVCNFLKRSRSKSIDPTTAASNFTAWWTNNECRTDTLLQF